MQAAIACLFIALVYVFIWPGRKSPEIMQRLSIWQRMVLRWFHSLTWILIALACVKWSKIPAAVAFLVYVIFIVTSLRVRNVGGR
jgi:hypothetical protein